MMKPVIGLTGTRHTRTTSLPGLPLQGVALADDYTQAVETTGGIPLVIPYPKDEASLASLVSHLDGLLLSGGEDIDPTTFGEEPHYGLGTVVAERDRLEITLVQMMRAQGKPILGICRGAQILNAALGGTLYQDVVREFKGRIQHSQKAARNHLSHRVKLEAGSKLAHCFQGETMIKVNSFHHQAVRNIAPSMKAVAWDAEGLVEGIETVDDEFVVAVQWHPENLWRDDERVLGLFRGLVDSAKGRTASS